MNNRGQPNGGSAGDPMARLDAAMNETFAELAESGSGVSPSDVLTPAPPERRRPRRAERPDDGSGSGGTDDGSWLETEQRPRRRAQRRDGAAPRRPAQPDPSAVITDEADDEDDDDTSTSTSTRTSQGRRSAADDDRAPQRDRQGRFLPRTRDTDDESDEDDDDADADSDEDEDDVADTRARSAGGRRAAADADEAEDDDDDFEPEGRQQADGDEDEDERPRQRRRRRRFPREVRAEIDRQVRTQVGKIVEERDRLKEAEGQRKAVENEAIGFLVKAIGTQQERDRLQERVNNTRLPIEQRNQAAALLNRYLSNEKYVRTYRTALLASIRDEQAAEDGRVATELGKYQIQLDPAIVAEGRRDKTLIHAVRQGILLERKRNAAEIARLTRALQTRRGSDSEHEVRNGRFGRASLASSNGRRANGRVAVVDRLRGAMGFERGLGAGTQVAAPTDETLRQLRDGEITLADLGLG